MDYYTNEQLYRYFENEIKKSAAKQSEALRNEIADLKDKELKKIQKELQDSIENATKLEMKELQVDHSYEINRIISDNSRKLMKRRLELLENVFSEAEAKLLKFVGSKEYEKLMEEKLLRIADKFSKCSIIFSLKPSDKALAEYLKANYKHKYSIAFDPEIKIGGFAVLCEELGVEIDETIDHRLKDQKEWFYANSNLFVK
ncbi:MAG: V-type ATP synthase subunit E [Bacilli bacterium]|nr:V-type ATP synthase subunit E [Bacilli bacterium]MBN2696371.1 V-type ATP synthase subunit E [Bacilli bacterium]